MALKVKDIYAISNDTCRIVDYYTGADYGVVTEDNTDVMEMTVERIFCDTDNDEACLGIAVS